MKLMTFNTHSLHGDAPRREIDELCGVILRERPDVVALQEVNQRADSEEADMCFTEGYYRAATCVSPIPIKRDNFALGLFWELAMKGRAYYFTWLPIKRGYGMFDEGLAFLTLRPIYASCGFYISERQDYNDWKTRMALLIELQGSKLSFCNVHTSRYDDRDEPFYEQWKRLTEKISQKERIFIMGDLNNPAEVSGEGYDRVLESGFYDLYRSSDIKEGYPYTVSGNIDGWREKNDSQQDKRIDFIFSSFIPPNDGISYKTALDGMDGEAVSDHFGVLVDIERMEWYEK